MNTSLRIHRRVAGFAAALLLVTVIGCGKGPDLGTVTGIIKVNGEPLPFAYVKFEPVTPPRNYGSAYADAEGRYELRFNESRNGAPVGKHRVSIIAARGDELPSDAPKAARVQLPASYNESSDLVADVKAGDNEIDFDLVVDKSLPNRQARRGSGG